MATTTDPDALTLRNVDRGTYRKLRDDPSHGRIGMTYLDGELTVTPGASGPGAFTLGHVDWEVYCKLRDDPAHDHLRMTYLDGSLTVMSPQLRHDRDSRRLLYVVTAVARAWRVRFLAVGTTTLRRQGRVDFEGAAKEPDEGFYLGDVVARIKGKQTLDLDVDPPPSLAIEVDNQADSGAALPAYAAIGVPEVWVHKVRQQALWFGALTGDGYVEIGRSAALPRLTPALVLQAFDAHADEMDDLDWLDWLDAWARALPEPPAAS